MLYVDIYSRRPYQGSEHETKTSLVQSPKILNPDHPQLHTSSLLFPRQARNPQLRLTYPFMNPFCSRLHSASEQRRILFLRHLGGGQLALLPIHCTCSSRSPINNLSRCILPWCDRLLPTLSLLLPLLWRIALRSPGVNGGDFGLQDSINKSMPCQRRFLFK